MSNKLLAGLAGAVGVLIIGIVVLAVAIVASSGGSSSNSKAASKQNTSSNGTPGAGSSSNTNSAKAPSSNVKGGELRVPGDDPLTLDPALAFDTTSAEYIVEIYGGLVQLLAGMWAFIKNDTFAAVALSSYGGFWISF